MDEQSPSREKIRFINRIQTRLILGLLLLAVLPLSFLGPYAYRNAQQGYEAQVGQNMQGAAYMVKSQIESALATGDHQIATWTRQEDAKIAPTVAGDTFNVFALLQKRFRNFLKGQLEIVPIFSEIICVKPILTQTQGHGSKLQAYVLYSTNEAHEGRTVFDGLWEMKDGNFQLAQQFLWENTQNVSQPLVSPFDTNTKVVPIARSYQDNNGQTVALIGLVKITEIEKLIAKTALGSSSLAELAKIKDTYALLTEENGKIIAGVFPESIFPDQSASTLLKELNGAAYGRTNLTAMGDAFIGQGKLAHGNWQILAIRDGTLAMAPIQSLRNTMVSAIVLLLAVIIVFSIKIARRITEPVQELMVGTRRASAGDLSQTISIQSQDEIGILAQCFNDMTAKLKNSFQILEQQNLELKRLDQLKTEFLANTSHELRTPLNGIIGLVEAALSGAFGEMNESLRSRLQLVLTSGDRLKKLVNNILDFSAGQNKSETLLVFQEIDLCALIKDQVVPQFEGMNLAKGVEFKMQFEAETPRVFADPEKLRQVFINLIGNAFKFTEQGSITVSTKVIRNEKGEKAHVQCSIQDTGIGIPKHLLDKIFDIFFQVDGSSARKYEGTGLGLAIAKQVIEQHGGKIWAESEVGVGTTVFIQQPILPEYAIAQDKQDTFFRPTESVQKSNSESVVIPTINEVKADTSQLPQTRNGRGETILVIDDESINVEVLRAQLEFHHYHVVGIHSGQEGLDYLKSAEKLPDLILLDIMMPEMSGYEFCKHLKMMPDAKNIPVVMISAKNQLMDRIYGLNLGALDYISKPFEKAELLAKIRVYLDLRHLQVELESINSTLERKVQERTEELEKAKAKAESLAMHDTLTGLPNRNLFQDRLNNTFSQSHRAENQRFAVAFIDLDNFKVINDSLGHEMGDKLLVAFGDRVKRCLREGDTLARFAGDEFTMILSGMQLANDATFVIDRIYDALKPPFIIDGREIHASASIGIALNSAGYNSSEDLLRDADTAMYQAKARGKGRYEVFSKDMHFIATERFKLETELRQGIKSKEFFLHYQPIISLETGQITSFEALIRWQHPERGFLSPLHFLGLAEETGLIVPLGQLVLEEACQQLRNWNSLFKPDTCPSLNINISARQLKDDNIVKDVLRIAQEYEISAEHLRLEITESALIVDLDRATELLLQLSKQNFALILDDFGTGYSSLNYLYRLPFQGLKIDQRFVESMLKDEKQAGIVRATIAIGQSLGLSVTAEGVETIEQVQFLRQAGCQFVQGYYFSRPVSAQQATKLLTSELPWLAHWEKSEKIVDKSDIKKLPIHTAQSV